MSDFLEQMALTSAARAAAASMPKPSELDRPLYRLAHDRFGVIAEIKARSPAEGQLAAAGADRVARARQYASASAAAISVLTEPSRFDGELAHLGEVAAAVPGTPVMRKDFLVDTVQVVEARAAGASGVLLIVAMLDDHALRAMLDCAAEHGLFVLLEAFDEADTERMGRILGASDVDRAAAGDLLFGVNTRNLRTLQVDTERLARLAPQLPAGTAVAESGIRTAADAADAARLGYSMALVGTALMRSDDPAALLGAMIAAGSAERAA